MARKTAPEAAQAPIVKRWMRDAVAHDVHGEVVDSKTGEVNMTKLAEECAIALGHTEWLDDELHPVWEWSMEVADGYKPNAAMGYSEAKEHSERLDAEATRLGRALRALSGGGPMGITPDHVRATPAWRSAKREFDAAFAALRNFNAVFVRRFKREMLQERRAKRGEGHMPNSGNGRAYRVWRGNKVRATYVTAPNVWSAVERAMDERGWSDMDDVRAEVRIGGEWQPAVEHEANAESGTEYPIWGIPPGKTEEDLLYTRATTMDEAKRVCRILETEHGVTRTRIQVLDLTQPPDFSNVLAKPGRRHRRNGAPGLTAADLRKMRVGDEVNVPCGPAGDLLFIKRTKRDEFFIRIPGHEHAGWGTAQQAADDIEQFVRYGALPRSSGARMF